MTNRLIFAVLAIVIGVLVTLLSLYVWGILNYSPWKFSYYGFWNVNSVETVDRCLRSNNIDYIFAAIDSIECAEVHLDLPQVMDRQSRMELLLSVSADPNAMLRWQKQSIPETHKYNGISYLIDKYNPANVHELVEMAVISSVRDMAIMGTKADMTFALALLNKYQARASAAALPHLEFCMSRIKQALEDVDKQKG